MRWGLDHRGKIGENPCTEKQHTPITAFCAPNNAKHLLLPPRTPASPFPKYDPGYQEEILEEPVAICRALAVGESNQKGFMIAQILPLSETRCMCKWNGVNGADSLRWRIRVFGSEFRRSLKAPNAQMWCDVVKTSSVCPCLGVGKEFRFLMPVPATPNRMDLSVSDI